MSFVYVPNYSIKLCCKPVVAHKCTRYSFKRMHQARAKRLILAAIGQIVLIF